MGLQTSGSISLGDIATEFGGSVPHSISEYYGKDGVSSSGAISFSEFYGKSSFQFISLFIASGSVWHSSVVANVGAYVFGYNNIGQVGDGTTTNRGSPLLITGGSLSGKTVVKISCGAASTVAIASDGTVHSWGYNIDGQLGDGTKTNRYVPVNITNKGSLSGKTIIDVSCGESHVMALASDGSVHTWGKNDNSGQVGNNNYPNDQTLPVNISNIGALSGKSIVKISAGSHFCFTVASNGTMQSWGNNSYYQLNYGGNSFYYPVNASISGKFITDISCGSGNVIAKASDNTVWAWGLGSSGQLGFQLSGSPWRSYPTRMDNNGSLSGKTVASIYAGYEHTFFIATDGTVHACGRNFSGQLGTGDNTNRFSPVNITNNGSLSGKTVFAIGTGIYHSMFLATDGTVHACGDNRYKQLGDGTTSNRYSPVNITNRFTPP